MATQIHGNSWGNYCQPLDFGIPYSQTKLVLHVARRHRGTSWERIDIDNLQIDVHGAPRGEKNLEWIGDIFLTSPRSVVHRLHQKLTEDHVECRVMLTCVRWKYLIQENPTDRTHQTRMEKFSSARLYMILASFSDQWNGIWRTSCSVDLHDLATSLLPVITVILLFSSTDQCELNNHHLSAILLWLTMVWKVVVYLQREPTAILGNDPSTVWVSEWRTDASVECRNGNSSLSVWLIWGKSNCVSWLVCKMHLMKW